MGGLDPIGGKDDDIHRISRIKKIREVKNLPPKLPEEVKKKVKNVLKKDGEKNTEEKEQDKSAVRYDKTGKPIPPGSEPMIDEEA
jgi:hypothetical protein